MEPIIKKLLAIWDIWSVTGERKFENCMGDIGATVNNRYCC